MRRFQLIQLISANKYEINLKRWYNIRRIKPTLLEFQRKFKNSSHSSTPRQNLDRFSGQRRHARTRTRKLQRRFRDGSTSEGVVHAGAKMERSRGCARTVPPPSPEARLKPIPTSAASSCALRNSVGRGCNLTRNHRSLNYLRR